MSLWPGVLGGQYTTPPGTDYLYFAERENHVVKRINLTTNDIELVAGMPGISGLTGDNNFAQSARMRRPSDICFDAAGNLYIADTDNHRIRRVNTSGIITTYVGTTAGAVDGMFFSARLRNPTGITYSPSRDSIYVADTGNHRIRRIVLSASYIETIVGGSQGFSDGPNSGFSTAYDSPRSVRMDHLDSKVMVLDGPFDITGNGRVRNCDPTTSGVTTTAVFDQTLTRHGCIHVFPSTHSASAGGSAPGMVTWGHNLGGSGIIRSLSAGVVSVYAGGTTGPTGDSANGQTKTAFFPGATTYFGGIASDSKSNVYWVETDDSTGLSRIRKVSAPDGTGQLSTIASDLYDVRGMLCINVP